MIFIYENKKPVSPLKKCRFRRQVCRKRPGWGGKWAKTMRLTIHTVSLLFSCHVSQWPHFRCQSTRLLASSWMLMAILLLADFLLVRTSRSLILAVPFHLALLSVFLFLNLIVHPLNLILLSRSRLQPQVSTTVSSE